MVQRNWTKTKIVDRMVEIHRGGHQLRAEVLQEQDMGLYSSLYYKMPDGRRKYFSSLKDAREAVAQRLESEGDLGGAQSVRDLNKSKKIPNKYSEAKKEQIRRRTLQEFKEKVDAGEDVRIRALRECSREFANRLERYVGYTEAFKHFGLNPHDYARHIKHSPKHYLGQLIRCIRRGDELDRTSMEQQDKTLVGSLNQHFNGYYDALRKAKEWLEQKGRLELAERADPEFWQQRGKEKRREKRKIELEQARNSITVINAEQEYPVGLVGCVQVEEATTGRDLAARLRSSDNWLTTQDVADRIKTTPINVSKNFPTMYPDKCVRFQNGSRHSYFFQASILNGHKRKNRFDSSPKDSLNKVSKSFGVGYSKVRNLADNLGLGSDKGSHRALSKDDIVVIKQVLERERKLKDEIVSKLSPDKDYTFRELEIMGIPVSHFYRKIRSGELPYGTRDGVMTISGEYALRYFEEQYASSHLSQGIRLITFFHPHLHTSTDLIQELKMGRSTVKHRLDTLLDENPDACFRIRKSEKRSKVIATDEVLPFLRNWKIRGGLQIISMMDKLSRNSSKKEAREMIRSAEKMIGEDHKVKRRDQLNAFGVFRYLREFLGQTMSVDGIQVSRIDLARLYKYMNFHDYKTVEIGNRFSLKEIGKMLDDTPLIESASTARQNLGFALYHTNEQLIGFVMNSMGIKSDLHLQEAQEGLMKAVEGFDPSFGSQFSSYAWSAIKRSLRTAQRKNDVSLHAKIGDDAEKIEFIRGESQKPYDKIAEEELDAKIKDLIETLTGRQRKIIIERFGFGGRKRKTLEKIGDELGISGERVRQIEEKALKKLAKNPDAKILYEHIRN